MLWLASFPRSGNTFFRILLHELYGIETAEYSLNPPPWWPRNYQDYPVVKTHELPGSLVPDDPSIPAVYLVRDGRDAVVSMARMRCNITAPGSNYHTNLRMAIQARKGSYFGGWSQHVRQWRRRANLVIRFEDLVQDPLGCVEKIRPWVNLPAPRLDKLPSFSDLKEKPFRFDNNASALEQPEIRKNFFRRGKVGAWKDEMPLTMRWLFYVYHGKMLRKMGYDTRSWVQRAVANN